MVKVRQTALPAKPDDTLLTVDALKGVMPKRQKHNITPAFVDKMNQLVVEPEAREGFRANLMSYTSVLSDPNVKLNTYIDAVRYVSFQHLGYTNQEAWMKVFPERYQRLVDLEKTDVFIRATVSNYNKNKIVNKIREQTMVPTWVLNHDMFQEALNTQLDIMTTSKNDKARTDAANSLLTHLKPPEATKLQLDVNVTQDNSIKELRDATLELARAQKLQIEAGNMSADEVAAGKIIQGESKRVD
jgi:hypothetical protein